MAPALATTIVVATLLTGGLVWLRPPGCKGKERGPSDLVVASSLEKFQMLKDLATDYNRKGFLTDGLQQVRTCVRIEEVPSGAAETALETGWRTNQPTDPQTQKPADKPDVWAPASSAWILLLEARAPGQAALVPSDYDRKSLFISPLVIAMPEPMAQTLGSSVSWQDISKLATARDGWGSRGKPWGPFRMVKTDPHVSTSGLHGLIGMYNSIRGDTSPGAVSSPEVQAFARGIERSVIHYGATARDFLQNLKEVDLHATAPQYLEVLGYVSAIAIEEKQVVDYNDGRAPKGSKPNVRLVPVYPKEAPVADHPYLILQWPDQTSIKLQAAADFFNFLTAPAQQKIVDDNGFRQLKGEAGPWLLAHPSIPERQPNSITLPTGTIIAAEIGEWENLRRAARVMILCDRGADGAALGTAVRHLNTALSDLKSQDRVMVATFPAPAAAPTYRVLQDFVPGDPAHLEQLRQALSNCQATVPAVPNMLGTSVRAALSWMASTYDLSSINAILLVEMSPGNDDQPGDPGLMADLNQQPRSQFVQVDCVGPAKNKRLGKIARAGDGACYPPDASSRFLRDLISNF